MELHRGELQVAGLSLYKPDPHHRCGQMVTENHKPDQNTKEAEACLYVAERRECVRVCALRLLLCKTYKFGKDSYFLIQDILLVLVTSH